MIAWGCCPFAGSQFNAKPGEKFTANQQTRTYFKINLASQGRYAPILN
jgi:hypothetical protein